MISVIVPVYKVEPYLNQCVESILCQTYSDLEILLVDDGSPDRCGQICDEYAKQDCRVKVFHTRNEGLSAARNLGLQNAKGEYIGFVDSDDWIEPEMYEVLLKRLEETESNVCICGFYQEPGTYEKDFQPDEAVYQDVDALKALLEGKKTTTYGISFIVERYFKIYYSLRGRITKTLLLCIESYMKLVE